MNLKGIYITDAGIDESSGGGNASYHEYEAFKRYCDITSLLTISDLPSDIRGGGDPFLKDFYFSNLVNDSYDIVHFNGHPFGRTLASLKYRNPKIKTVSSIPAHSIEKSRDAHYAVGIDYDKTYPHMVQPELLRRYTEHDRKSDLIIFPSRISMSYYIGRFEPLARCLVIPHGCYLPKEYPTIPTNPSTIIFGYIGAPGVDKGFLQLVTAFTEIGATLRLFGRQMDNLNKSHLPPNIQVYGGFKTLGDIMDKFDVGVFPSISEGFNIPALECMAWGKPIIISDGAGASELITRNGDGGIIIHPKYEDTLKENVESLIKYKDMLEPMGRLARKVAEKYPWSAIEHQYETAYRTLM
jgi:glycosyltransferase involved in cell wall biosynthesis